MARRLAVVFLLSACLRSPPQPPPRSPPQVPRGCLDPQAGHWVLLGDPSFVYFGVDDGGALQLTAHRAPPAIDAGFRPRRFRLDAGAEPAVDGGLKSQTEEPLAVIVLDRTPKGFFGTTRARLTDAQGRDCEVSFRTELLECGDGGLRLKTEPFADLDEGCQVLRPSTPPPLIEHRLVRAP